MGLPVFTGKRRCPACDSRGELAGEVGCAGYGDPETHFEIDTCIVCRGGGRVLCATCGDDDAKFGALCLACACFDLVEAAPGLAYVAIDVPRWMAVARLKPAPA